MQSSFQIDATLLSAAVRRVASVHTGKGQKLFLQVGGHQVVVAAVNGAQAMSEAVRSIINPGLNLSICLPLDDLRAILTHESKELQVESLKVGVKIDSEQATYHVPIFDEQLDPIWFSVAGVPISVDPAELSRAFILSGASDDYDKIETYRNFKMNVVCLETSDNGRFLWCMTVDPKCLAAAFLPIKNQEPDFPVRLLLPESACRLVSSIFPKQSSDYPVAWICSDEKRVLFENATSRFVTPLSTGNFPKRTDFVQKGRDASWEMPVLALMDALRRASVFDDGDLRGVTLKFDRHRLEFESRSKRSRSSCQASNWSNYQPERSLAFDPLVPLEFLQRAKHCEVELVTLGLSRSRAALQLDTETASFVWAPKAVD